MKTTGIALAAALAGALVPRCLEPDAEGALGQTTPPDRLSVDRDSPFFDPIYKRIGVRLDGFERPGDVQEYCMSEGWIDVRRRGPRGFLKDREGEWILVRLRGTVIAYIKDDRPTRVTAPAYQTQSPEAAQAAIDAAAAKRTRRAAKLAKQSNA